MASITGSGLHFTAQVGQHTGNGTPGLTGYLTRSKLNKQGNERHLSTEYAITYDAVLAILWLPALSTSIIPEHAAQGTYMSLVPVLLLPA
jgi:hypothetical protein